MILYTSNGGTESAYSTCLRITQMSQKHQRKFAESRAKVLLLTDKSETGFPSFILTRCLCEINIDQDAHQTLIKIV